MDFIPFPLLVGSGIAALVVIAGAVLSQYLDDLNRFIRTKPLWHLIFIFLLVVRMILFGGSKTNDVELAGVGDTNEIGGVVLNAPERMFNRGSVLCCCEPLRTCDYELVGVTTNEGCSYEMPSNGTVRGTWRLSGAHEAIQKVGLDGFEFPLGRDLLTYLWSSTSGKVRTRFAQPSNEITIVGAPMSALPGVSRFWTAETPSNTYQLTWENFAAGRIPVAEYQPSSTNCRLLSAQLELKRDGSFVARSNGVERLYRRVVPGVETEGYGPQDSEPYMENVEAYYSIDLVCTADARVTFVGDGPSNMPDPDFFACAGETYSVDLLIGKTYTIECDMPFEITGASDWRVDVWQGTPRTATVVWPVLIYRDVDDLFASGPHNAPLLGSRSGGAWLRVDPDWLAGTVSMPTNACCGIAGSAGAFSLTCNDDCGCDGCTISGSYTYEGYTISFGGWECGCHSHDENEASEFSEWGLSVPEVVFKDGGLRELNVWFDPGEDDDNSGNLVLTQVKGHGRIRLWTNERKTSTASRFSWPVAEGVDCTYYVEGIESSDSVGDIEFRLEWVKADAPDPVLRQTTCAEVEEVIVETESFTGQEPHGFDVTHSLSPDQHVPIFFGDVVVGSDLTPGDFFVDIELRVKPAGADVGQANWMRLGPTPPSGLLYAISEREARLANPNMGGIYHIGATFNGSPTNECNVVLPLAGASVDGLLRNDLARADAFAADMVAHFPEVDRNQPLWGLSLFGSTRRGNYLGRPDNAESPTVWHYNQVSDSDGKGAVATLSGVPIRVAKLSNLIVGYTCERMGVYRECQELSQFLGTRNDASAEESWDCGNDLANGADFDAAVAALVRSAWLSADLKTRRLWPNPNSAMNWSSQTSAVDWNHFFYSPEYLDLRYAP